MPNYQTDKDMIIKIKSIQLAEIFLWSDNPIFQGGNPIQKFHQCNPNSRKYTFFFLWQEIPTAREDRNAEILCQPTVLNAERRQQNFQTNSFIFQIRLIVFISSRQKERHTSKELCKLGRQRSEQCYEQSSLKHMGRHIQRKHTEQHMAKLHMVKPHKEMSTPKALVLVYQQQWR